MNLAERVARRIAAVVIALFLCAFGLFVAIHLLGDPARLLRFLRSSVYEPGCWLVLLGPVAFWICFVTVALRVPRELRSRRVGQLGRTLHIGSVLHILRTYRAQHGFDAVLTGLLVSGSLSMVLLWGAAANSEDDLTLWLLFVTSLWVLFASWLVFFSGRGKRGRSD